MKIVKFIFSFYILFLALQPGIHAMAFSPSDETYCCGNSSCETGDTREADKVPGKEGCADKGFCNPFQTCSNCVAFTSEPVRIQLAAIPFFSNIHAEIKSSSLPLVSLDFWQPPKIS